MPTFPAAHRQGARLPWRLAAAALLLDLALLGWEHLHGGIPTHHFLQSAAMPGFSNAWGLLLLPALAGWAGWRVHRHLARGGALGSVAAGAGLGLAWGLALSAAFSAGLQDVCAALFLGALVLAVLAPAWRAECLLGWVLGMVGVFGPVIPTVVGGAVASLSALVHRLLRPALARGWRRLRRR